MTKVSDDRSHVRIGLYVAVSTALENKPLTGSHLAKFKSALVRLVDRTNWHFFRQTRIHYHHWDGRPGSNKGDIAIRESTKDAVRAALYPKTVEFDELAWGELLPHGEGHSDNAWDAFVVGGSGYITSDENGELSTRMASDLTVLNQMDCVKILFGVGWNTLLVDDGKPLALSLGAKDLIKSVCTKFHSRSVRDSATKQLLDSLSGTPAFLMGDPAFLWHSTGRYPSIPKTPNTLRVGLNFALHGAIGTSRFERMFETYCALLRDIQRRHDVEFHHVQHSYAERLVPSIFRSRGIEIIPHDPPTDQLIDLYGQLDLHICEMMHSSILSMAAGTPAINLAYDVKNLGFYDLMRLSRFCHPISLLDHAVFLDSVDDVIANAGSIRQTIALRKGELQREQEIVMKDIKEKLASSGRQTRCC